ncbi:replication protein rep, partial [Streptococcus gallolyticus]
HHNDLNTVVMRKWTAEEMNFFFAIIAKAKGKGTSLIEFDKYELAELAKYSLEHNKRFKTTMERLVDKIGQLRYIEKTSNSIKYMALFQRFEVHWETDLSDMTAYVRVAEDFEYILNKLSANFTSYELEEFTKIRSTYAKTAYRLLKQWRTVGKKEFSIDEFKTLMDMPKSYKSSEIDRAVIKPILKELNQYFIGLKVKKIKSNKRGNPVLGYEFTWKPETTGEWEDDKYKKNDFYKPKKSKSNVPDWVEKEYKHSATAEEQAQLEELRRSMLED